MTNRFAAGHKLINDTFKDQASELLTYRRLKPPYGGRVQIAMTSGGPKHPLFSVLGSQPGSIDFLLANPENAIRSFVFAAIDLDFGLGPVLPEESGDQILETIGGIVCVFNVMPPMTGLLAWDYVSNYRGPEARLIVHTQLTGTEK